MDQAEVWKISGRKSSGLLQEIKATTPTKYFRSMHLIFNIFLLPWSRKEMKIRP